MGPPGSAKAFDRLIVDNLECERKTVIVWSLRNEGVSKRSNIGVGVGILDQHELLFRFCGSGEVPV
jgi:hypothetical protein